MSTEPAAGQLPDAREVSVADVLDAPVLDFSAAGRADDPSGSVQRAREHGDDALVVSRSTWAWAVAMPDGTPHTVALGLVDGTHRGWCDCDGFQFHDGPCAHLCVVKMREVVSDSDATGETVTLPQATSDAQAATDGGHVDDALRADRLRGDRR